MLNPSVQLDNIRAWTGALLASVAQVENRGPEDAYGAAARVPQWRGANTTPSAQPEKTEHEKDDDDGTDEPDDSVHDGCPLMARVGCKRGSPARIGLVPREPI
jgi:hypothetical protein